MRARLLALTAGLFATLTPIAAAADTALLIVNDRYPNAQNLREGGAVEQLRGDLRNAGFDVITVTDGTGAEMRQGLGLLLDAEESERILVAVVGHFARSQDDNWVVASDADEPTLATISGDGLSLSVLMEAASSAPGRSVVLLGLERRRITLGHGLGVGIGQIEAPQGVSVVAGTPEDIAEFAREDLLTPGTDLSRAIQLSQGLRSFGFLSPVVPFIADAVQSPAPAPVPVPPVTGLPTPAETALWAAAVELDTAGSYRAYLNRYPNGFYAGDAAARIDAFENDPAALAVAAEEALDLTRPQRRQIQRNLSTLDYDTRGIDGLFGAGTRRAISAWQGDNGLAATGFVDAEQIARLDQQARLRAAEIEEEERIAEEERRRADEAYWQVTGQGATDEGLRDYLERFPDGIYATSARDILDIRDRQALAVAREADEAAWQVARGTDTVAAYRAYLDENPQGAFRDRARQRINALTGQGGQGGADTAQLLAQENALNIPPVTRSIIEQRLTALGLQPGRIDGRFDDNTRRAIAQYQDARGLDATGFLNQRTVARLLAETFGGILQIDGIINR
jgi:peptidoglycan hydrolase-like protein with peptidoglycan-binding domain